MARPVSQGGIDYPDGGFSSGAGTFPVVGDLGELAVRLGSCYIFNREGNVLFYGDFGDGVGSVGVAELKAGDVLNVVSTPTHTGRYALYAICSGQAGNGIYVKRLLPVPPLSRWGGQVSFRPKSNSYKLRILIDLYTGEQNYAWNLRYGFDSLKLEYIDANGVYQTVRDGLEWEGSELFYHTMKLVVDPATGEYVRSIFDAYEDDLSGIPCRVNPSAVPPFLGVNIHTYGNGINIGEIYLDSFVVTANEPSR